MVFRFTACFFQVSFVASGSMLIEMRGKQNGKSVRKANTKQEKIKKYLHKQLQSVHISLH